MSRSSPTPGAGHDPPSPTVTLPTPLTCRRTNRSSGPSTGSASCLSSRDLPMAERRPGSEPRTDGVDAPRLLMGDCLALLSELPADSVDAVVTDPPYDLLQVSRGGSPRSEPADDAY